VIRWEPPGLIPHDDLGVQTVQGRAGGNGGTQGVIQISSFDSEQASGPCRWSLAALLAVLAVLAIPATALAQADNPTEAQYEPVTEQIDQGPGTLTEVQTGGPGDPADQQSADRPVAGLPFTGLDIGLLAAVAALLGGSGLLVRRMSRAPSED
jgi:hypothetical protein